MAREPGRRAHAPTRLACAALASIVAWACGGPPDEPPPPPDPAATRSPPPAGGAKAAPTDTIVARVGDTAITATQLDDAIRLQLHDLDRARWELRARRLHEIAVGRVLGPRAAAEGVSIEEWVRRHAPAGDVEAFVAGELARAGVERFLPEPEPPVVEVSADDDAVRGAVDAPVTIVAFIDFQSPHYARMQPVLQQLLARYAGLVRLVARDLPLPVHRDAARAAEAAECAGEQGDYWTFHDLLLQARDDLGDAALARHAHRAGLDHARFARCLQDRTMRAEVEADAADARRLGVGGVPTFFVNGRYLRGPQPYAVLAARVEAELAARGIPVPAPPAATPVAEPAPGAASAPHVTLRGAEVREALRHRRRLARDLDRPPGDLGPGLEGRRLVRVRRVRPGTLYDRLGLHPGDVLVTVDGAPLLDSGDALFDALRDRSSVTVQLLRRGLPHTYTYAIE